MNYLEEYPEYLQSFDLLQQHVRAQLDGLTTLGGERKEIALPILLQRLIPQCEVGGGFEFPELSSKKSVDGGSRSYG